MTGPVGGLCFEANKQQGFLGAFTRELIRYCYRFEPRNIDRLRFPGSYGRKWALKEWMLTLAERANFVYVNQWSRGHIEKSLSRVLDDADRFDWLYRNLADENSRRLLLQLLAFRILGSRRVKLPTNNPRYWEGVAAFGKKLVCQRRSHALPGGSFLDLYDLQALGYPIRLHGHPLSLLATFFLHQYRYQSDGVCIEARPGDVVLDGGGCWGDTPLYMASLVGTTGRVFTFEFVPSAVEVIQKNIGLNPLLGGLIRIVPEALWDKTGETIGYCDSGASSSLVRATTPDSELVAQTVAIDDFVARERLGRVDFIKMDIEGAEPSALRGAEDTLREFRPRLAISVYHAFEHLTTIPQAIERLGLSYRFYLGHSSIHAEETILFASP
jgi:FkbM family methyltransferase